MSLSLWNRSPLMDEFSRTRDEMDRMLGRVIGSGMFGPDTRLNRMEGWLPPVDVCECEEEVTVRVEIPGIAMRDLELTITGSTLSISGKKEECEQDEQVDFYRCERRFGAFRRAIDLPESVDPDRVTADAENGIVTVHLAKKPGQRTRRIEVKHEARPTARRIPVPG